MRTLAELDTMLTDAITSRKPLTYATLAKDEREDFMAHFGGGKHFTPEQRLILADKWLEIPNQTVVDNCNAVLPPYTRISPATTTGGKLVVNIDLLSDAETFGKAASILKTFKCVLINPDTDFPQEETI